MAGEIQLNSTTMATESSGSITLSNVNSATNRTNLGLGSMATQNANAVALTGGSVTGTEIDLKSSGTTIFQSDGTTAVLSESGGVVSLGNSVVGSIQGYELYTLSSDITADGPITGLTLQNSAPFTSKGSLITESSGVISFNSTGVYQILGSWDIRYVSGTDTIIIYTQTTTDGSTFSTQFRNQITVDSTIQYNRLTTLAIINCTDTSLVKFQFNGQSITVGKIAGGNPGGSCHTQIIVMKIG